MNTITKIQISRCEIVYGDKTAAIVHLNNYNHIIGQPVMVRYNTADGGTDTITAIGLSNGQGPDCYSIISMGEERYIGGVLDRLPDVSSLVHNISYVAKFNDVWSLFYIDDTESIRQISELQSGDKFYSLEDDHRYYYRDGKLFRDDDSASVLEGKITLLTMGGLELTVKTDDVVKKVGEVFNLPELDVKVMTSSSEEDITDNCEFTASTASGTNIPVNYADGKVKLMSNISETTEVIVTATYTIEGETPIKASKKIKFYILEPIYYGERRGLEREYLWDEELGRLELEFDLDKDRCYLKTPSSWPIFEHIYDANGLDYISDYTITEESNWRIYEKTDPVTIENFRQIFSYTTLIGVGGVETIENYDLISTYEFNQIFTR